jgi:hypothetical protein
MNMTARSVISTVMRFSEDNIDPEQSTRSDGCLSVVPTSGSVVVSEALRILALTVRFKHEDVVDTIIGYLQHCGDDCSVVLNTPLDENDQFSAPHHSLLSLAVSLDSTPIAKALVNAGASAYIRDSRGLIPIMKVASVECLRAILDGPVNMQRIVADNTDSGIATADRYYHQSSLLDVDMTGMTVLMRMCLSRVCDDASTATAAGYESDKSDSYSDHSDDDLDDDELAVDDNDDWTVSVFDYRDALTEDEDDDPSDGARGSEQGNDSVDEAMAGCIDVLLNHILWAYSVHC